MHKIALFHQLNNFSVYIPYECLATINRLHTIISFLMTMQTVLRKYKSYNQNTKTTPISCGLFSTQLVFLFHKEQIPQVAQLIANQFNILWDRLWAPALVFNLVRPQTIL